MANWFTDPITQAFSSQHTAVDIGTPFHSPITALWSGVVTKADTHPYGGEVWIQSQVPGIGSVRQGFVHLDAWAVKPGQTVSAGQVIGLSGGENPGFPGAINPALPKFSTGPHTHFSLMTSSGQYLNPAPILKNIGGTSPLPDPSQIGPIVSAGVAGAGLTLGNAASTLNPLNMAGEALHKVGFFIIALMIALFGLLLLVWEPTQKIAVSSAKTAARVAEVA